MEECNICLTKIKRQNKNKHQRSKRHKYFLSNVIINKYVVKSNEINNFKDILKTYYLDHKKKFNSFSVLVVLKTVDGVEHKIKLQSCLIMENGEKLCYEYINDCLSIDSFCDEINIIFISNFRDITFYHYMNQPMSKLTRKHILNILQNQSCVYTQGWLPNCFALNYKPTDKYYLKNIL